MSKYYNPGRGRNLFAEKAETAMKLSRTKLDLFLNCPRCFYLDRKLDVPQPPGYPFSLNNAVDRLLKKEFDIHRANGDPHPLMKAYGVAAVPFQHPNLNVWRNTLKGIQHLHEATNFLITGAIDDLWVNNGGELHVVDYKATAKDSEVNLDADWQIGYKRQMEIYQWLFRRNAFKVSDTGYFVYANGLMDRGAFDGKLEFSVKIIPYEGDDSWVEEAILAARRCLASERLPLAGEDCDYCRYRQAAGEAVQSLVS